MSRESRKLVLDTKAKLLKHLHCQTMADKAMVETCILQAVPSSSHTTITDPSSLNFNVAHIRICNLWATSKLT
jgi:hypothetical protein